MKIDVVIPVKNGRDTLAECIEGILSQKIDHEVEILVIDSGSTARTEWMAAPMRCEDDRSKRSTRSIHRSTERSLKRCWVPSRGV